MRTRWLSWLWWVGRSHSCSKYFLILLSVSRPPPPPSVHTIKFFLSTASAALVFKPPLVFLVFLCPHVLSHIPLPAFCSKQKHHVNIFQCICDGYPYECLPFFLVFFLSATSDTSVLILSATSPAFDGVHSFRSCGFW